MLNYAATEALVRDRHDELVGAAARHRLRRQHRPQPRAHLRARAGSLLVGAGLRLAGGSAVTGEASGLRRLRVP